MRFRRDVDVSFETVAAFLLASMTIGRSTRTRRSQSLYVLEKSPRELDEQARLTARSSVVSPEQGMSRVDGIICRIGSCVRTTDVSFFIAIWVNENTLTHDPCDCISKRYTR